MSASEIKVLSSILSEHDIFGLSFCGSGEYSFEAQLLSEQLQAIPQPTVERIADAIDFIFRQSFDFQAPCISLFVPCAIDVFHFLND